MCGIIGIVSLPPTFVTSKQIIRSLKWLSYRGYDSAGFAIKTKRKIIIKKDKGNIENMIRKGKLPTDIRGYAGIGHTRWATHGKVSQKNAHPHHDCSEKIVVVHNGIINNYIELREELIKRKHKFTSDTDTEVIPHLIEEYLKNYMKRHEENAFLYAFRDAVNRLEGSYAIAALWLDDPHNKIYATRKYSPLIIGIPTIKSCKKQYIASDIPAIVEHEKNDFLRYIPLDDHEICVLNGEKYRIYDFNLTDLTDRKTYYRIPYSKERISKGGYRHFMKKEIYEQPSAIVNTAEIFKKQIKGDFIRELKNHIQKKEINKIFLMGCGSSYHACLFGEIILEKLFYLPAKAVLSSEFKYTFENIVDNETLLIVLSQSGETYDTYLIVHDIIKNEKIRPHILAITNIPHSSLERLIKNGIINSRIRGGILNIDAGLELCVVATKTYISQLYMLFLLGMELFRGEGITSKYLEDKTKKLKESIEKILNEKKIQNTVKSIAEKYKNSKGFFIIGREINLPSSLEGALKIREVCYLLSHGLPGGELKHGSLAVVDENTPTIVLFPSLKEKDVWLSTFNNLMEIKARGGPIISICHEGDERVKNVSDHYIEIPEMEWFFNPILNVIPLQLLAYEMALKKGIEDPDHPRNLAKTVTVE